IDVWGNDSGYAEKYVIEGYDGNIKKASAEVNFSISNTYESGEDSQISWTRLSSDLYSRAGELVFDGSAWADIDRVKFTIAEAGILGGYIDNLQFDDPVVPFLPAQTATAAAQTLTPSVGADNTVTLTVNDSLGNTDTDFDGAHNVTITGVEQAPDGSHGSFAGTGLDADSAGAGQTISVTFTD